MDRISGLPDELLLKILSSVPIKVAVSTSILSKRWKFLWLWLPKLDYSSLLLPLPTFRDFIDRNLTLHRAPVIESLHLELNSRIELEDFKKWVDIALSRCVRELDISYFYRKDEDIFPSAFYTCKSLVILKLKYVTLIDVPSMACLPSLKTLHLEGVRYKEDELLQQLLSACPILEDLFVFLLEDDNVRTFTIIVLSLQKLDLIIHDEIDEFEIDTPTLKYLKFEGWNDWPHGISVKDMPMLREAYVDAICDLENVIGSITSVERLTICSNDDEYGDGIVFNKLEHLTLCVCKKYTSNLLSHLLKDSPNLRVLDIGLVRDHGDEYDCIPGMGYWNQPSPVPECLLWRLQIVNWTHYFGSPQEIDIMVYILKNAPYLKRATVWADSRFEYVTNLTMIKDLAFSYRASSRCELEFVEDDE